MTCIIVLHYRVEYVFILHCRMVYPFKTSNCTHSVYYNSSLKTHPLMVVEYVSHVSFCFLYFFVFIPFKMSATRWVGKCSFPDVFILLQADTKIRYPHFNTLVFLHWTILRYIIVHIFTSTNTVFELYFTYIRPYVFYDPASFNLNISVFSHIFTLVHSG